MHVRQLIRDLGTMESGSACDGAILDVVSDPRRVIPGSLFVVLPDQESRWPDLVERAVTRGASAIAAERYLTVPARVTRIRTKDAVRLLSGASSRFYGAPSRDLPVIGVVDGSGRGGVGLFLRYLLEGAGYKAGLIARDSVQVGERLIRAEGGGWQANDVQRFLGQFRRMHCSVAVWEIGGVKEARWARDISLRQMLLHEGVPLEERAVWEELDGHQRGQEEWPYHLLAGGGESTCQTGEKCWSYGVGETTIQAAGIRPVREGLQFKVSISGETTMARVPWIDPRLVVDAMGALSSAVQMGFRWRETVKALGSLPEVPGCLERVREIREREVYVDGARHPAELRRVLGLLRARTRGRVVVVFGCGESSSRETRWRMGQSAAAMADGVVVTTDNAGESMPAQLAEDIVCGAGAIGHGWVVTELDRLSAIETAFARTARGDVVLIAGKGAHRYDEHARVCVPFDDVEEAVRAARRQVPMESGYAAAEVMEAEPVGEPA